MIAWLATKLGLSQIGIELIALALISAVFFYGGWHLRGIFTEASETIVATKALNDQQTADKEAFNKQVKEAKAQDLINKMNLKLNQDVQSVIVKTPKASCTITTDRVQLLNRAASRK